MKITRSYLKQIIKEEFKRIQEIQGGELYSSGDIKVTDIQDVSTSARDIYEFKVTGTFKGNNFAKYLDFFKSSGQYKGMDQVMGLDTVNYDFEKYKEYLSVLVNAVKSSKAWLNKETRLKNI